MTDANAATSFAAMQQFISHRSSIFAPLRSAQIVPFRRASAAMVDEAVFMRGLGVAVALVLPFWTAVGFCCWALLN